MKKIVHGAMYVTVNYVVRTHRDPDRTWTVVLVLGGERRGLFYSASHKWAIELKPCTIFWFKSRFLHGTTDCVEERKSENR